MATKIPVADEAIALVAMTALLDGTEAAQLDTTNGIAEALVTGASRVQFQPSTRRLVLTFDLGMSAEPDSPRGD